MMKTNALEMATVNRPPPFKAFMWLCVKVSNIRILGEINNQYWHLGDILFYDILYRINVSLLGIILAKLFRMQLTLIPFSINVLRQKSIHSIILLGFACLCKYTYNDCLISNDLNCTFHPMYRCKGEISWFVTLTEIKGRWFSSRKISFAGFSFPA